MFVDAGVFDAGWTPRDLKHRDAEADAIAGGVRPLLDGRSPGPVLVHGESGVGKTCTTDHILSQLDANEPEVQTAQVNCWQVDNVHQVYEDIHEQVVGATTRDRAHAAEIELFRDIEDAVADHPLVLALDEADELGDAQFFYRFAQLRNVALVCIAYTPESFERSISSERALSRMGPLNRVPFDRYAPDEMADILWGRASAGLEVGVVDEKQIDAIAQTTRNAHEAIKTLESAANQALEEGYNEIQDSLIAPANDDARQVLRERRLKYLDEHQLALYEIVTASDRPLSRGEIQCRYECRVEEPRTSDRWCRETLGKLASYDLIRAEGEGGGRRYRTIEAAPDAAAVRSG